MRQLVIVATLVLIAQLALAATPETMSYQGVLRDASGTPVPDATYSITFRLYDVATGGTELWTESQSLATSGGVFDAILGSVVPLSLAFNDEYWLGVQVESDPELAPRTELTSAPYALRAKYGELTLPYSGSATSGSFPTLRIENPEGPSILAVSDFTTDGNAAIRADATNGQMYAAMGFYNGGTTWGLYTPRSLYAFAIQSYGDIVSQSGDGHFDAVHVNDLHLQTSPTDGYVLTSDASGYGTWQAPVAGSDGDWTISGDDLYSSAVGNVGVGTTTPEEKLHVRNEVVGGVSYAAKLDNPSNTAGTSVGVLFKVDGGTEFRGKGGLVYERTNTWNRGSFHFLQDGGATYANPDLADAVMTIDNDGNVGIGTMSPAELLQVAGTVHSTSGGFKFPDGSTQTTSAMGGLTLPYVGAASSAGNVFDVSNDGTGRAVLGTHTSTGNYGYLGGPIHGIYGLTNITSGAGVYAKHEGSGPAVYANAAGGTGVEASSGTGSGVWATSSSGDALHAITYNGRAFYGEDADGKTVTICDADYGVSVTNTTEGTSGHVAGPNHGLYGATSVGSGAGVYGKHNGSGVAVYANAPSGTAVEASSGTGSGVWASTSSGDAVHAITYDGRALYAEDADGKTATLCDTDYGAHASNSAGTQGHIAGGSHGVYGETSLNYGSGVYGKHNGSGAAVFANAPGGTGVEASSGTGSGVWATSSSGDALHAISLTGYAGYFEGGIRTDGFEFPTGATSGYPLVSDATGVGSWSQIGPVALSDPMDFGAQTWDWDFSTGKLDVDITDGYNVLDITNSSATGYGGVALLRSTSTTVNSGGTRVLRVTSQKGNVGSFQKYTADGYSAPRRATPHAEWRRAAAGRPCSRSRPPSPRSMTRERRTSPAEARRSPSTACSPRLSRRSRACA